MHFEYFDMNNNCLKENILIGNMTFKVIAKSTCKDYKTEICVETLIIIVSILRKIVYKFETFPAYISRFVLLEGL